MIWKRSNDMVTINYKKVYEQEFAKLNPKQKEAVETVEGPVMVIAGPGTGKTQILSRRVANILLNYETKPEEIVCLTYTEAGASEMLDRLEKLLGERGRNVRVSTIHAFCSDLILSNPDYFQSQPRVISTALQYELLKEMMDEHIQEGSALYKNSGDRYSSKEQLLDLLSRMKLQRLEKADIKGEVDEYFKTIELAAPGDELYKKFRYSRKTTNKNTGAVYQAGDWKPDFKAEQAKFDKLIEATEIVQKYQNSLAEKNFFDFDDMILWTKDLLTSNQKFQEAVAQDIKYLFVDEFQDTSVIQNELVDLLVAGKGHPNIFVVGDDDQSIYRFQGVSATNIEDFGKKYQPIEIVLEENYRSSQVIIDAARSLISHNPRKDKVLKASGANKDYAPTLPTLTKYETEDAEMLGILEQVKVLIEKGTSPAEIGIIYGRNSYGKALAKLFKENGIPVQIKVDELLFEDPFFKKLQAVLKYINRPNRHLGELRKLLYLDIFQVPVEDLVAMREATSLDEVNSETIKQLDKKMEQLRFKLAKTKQYLSPIYVLQQVLSVLEIDRYMLQSADKYHLVSVLTALYDLMVNESLIRPKLSLSDFLSALDGLKEMKVAIAINELESSPDNCVNLMTAHGSKGLEFDHVFMAKCNDGQRGVKWPGGQNTRGSFSYPPSLSAKASNEKELKEQEDRRLFYVAMTRAKKELHLSYSAENPLTHFMDELEGHYQLIQAHQEARELSKAVVRLPQLSNKVVADIASDFSLSVSVLNSFLNCDLSFYFNKVLKFPAETNEAMTFGSMVHSIFEAIYVSDEDESQSLTPKTVLPKEEAIKAFEAIFERDSWKLPSDRARHDDYARGLAIIENFYQAKDYLKPGIVAVEKNIKGIKLGDIKDTSVDLSQVAEFELNGKIDKIEVDGDIIRVIDYKTGVLSADKNKRKKKLNKLNGPTDDNPSGEDYWRQAVFYYILVKHSDIDLTGKKLEVQYVFVEDETDEKGFSIISDITIDEEAVDQVLEQIKAVLLKIKAGDYTTGCGHFNTYKKANGLKVYPCDYCQLATLNVGPLLDNSQAIETASYHDSVKAFKSLSVSTLNRFLDCSNTFYFDHVLKLTTVAGLKTAPKVYSNKLQVKHAPTGPVFGTVMHQVMERIYKEDLDLQAALLDFDTRLAAHEDEIFDTMSAKDMKPYGHQLLKNLFDSYIPQSCKQVELEREISLTIEQDLPITGIIDKLEYDGDTIRVVDYKTGSASHGSEELEKGGHYWRQAVYYNLLLNKAADIDTDGKRIETRYIFLDDDSTESGYSIHDMTVTSSDMEIVTQEIQDFWSSIPSGEFRHACGKESCDFCRLAELSSLSL